VSLTAIIWFGLFWTPVLECDTSVTITTLSRRHVNIVRCLPELQLAVLGEVEGGQSLELQLSKNSCNLFIGYKRCDGCGRDNEYWLSEAELRGRSHGAVLSRSGIFSKFSALMNFFFFRIGILAAADML
jgi:hypothetical protein